MTMAQRQVREIKVTFQKHTQKPTQTEAKCCGSPFDNAVAVIIVVKQNVHANACIHNRTWNSFSKSRCKLSACRVLSFFHCAFDALGGSVHFCVHKSLQFCHFAQTNGFSFGIFAHFGRFLAAYSSSTIWPIIFQRHVHSQQFHIYRCRFGNRPKVNPTNVCFSFVFIFHRFVLCKLDVEFNIKSSVPSNRLLLIFFFEKNGFRHFGTRTFSSHSVYRFRYTAQCTYEGKVNLLLDRKSILL